VQHDTSSHGSLKTASVDYETDHKIQDTIANEFKDRTILCIARALNTVVPEVSLTDIRTIDRLRTIIGYDRICVLDAGAVAVCHHVFIVRSYELIFFFSKTKEFDTPANLYMANGIFRGMCDQSSISLDDITHAERIAT
jgi:ABC-type multidrug transport system fused ATPase/permease subunit